MHEPPSVLNIHTPWSSFAIVHSLTQETLLDLCNKLSRKPNTDYYGERVGPGWLKYEYNSIIWNLDDDSDYTIFSWRTQQSDDEDAHPAGQSSYTDDAPIASSSKTVLPAASVTPSNSHKAGSGNHTPTLHLHNPKKPLPSPPNYCNPSYYIFHAQAQQALQTHKSLNGKQSPASSSRASTSRRSKKGGKVVGLEDDSEEDGVPKFKKQFNRFHSENGVRTVIGGIGSVQNVRMLLKSGYRHVYISRKFAMKHGFIPDDAAPGNYGYGGLVNIGMWPITLVPSASQPHKPKPKLQKQPGGAYASGYQPPDAFGAIMNRGSNPSPPVSQGYASTIDTSVTATAANTLANTHTYTHTHTHTRQLSASSRIPHSSASSILTAPHASTIGKAQSMRGTKSKSNGHHRDLSSSSTTGNGIGTHTPTDDGTTKVVSMEVYLSEEPHFDVVLGRSFFEKRQIKLSTVDPTDVVCLDTGEKIECELVILKDGRGEIVTVT